eukprot:14000732-Ditylum_brightwellii.AAC.1
MAHVVPEQDQLWPHQILYLKMQAIHLQKAQEKQKRKIIAVFMKIKIWKKDKMKMKIVQIMLISKWTQPKMVQAVEK